MYYVLRRTGAMISTLLLVSVITFTIFQIIPGDPIMAKLGLDADPAQVAALRNELGLDNPVPIRYFKWLGKAVQGDFGESIRFTQPVSELLKNRFSVTLSLAVISLSISMIVGISLGLLAAKYNNTTFGLLISVITQLGMSVPSFWVGILLILVFSIIFRWFAPGGYIPWSENPWGAFRSLFLPSLAIALPKIAEIVRYLRTTVIEQLKQDYVRTAYGKGLGFNRILYTHVVRNALVPVITVIGMIIADVLAGSLIIEQVFTLPGLGRLLIMAISNRDFPLVQGMVMYIAFIVVIINLSVDMMYCIIDPRISLH